MEDELKSGFATLIQDGFRGMMATLLYLAGSITHDVVVHGREHVSDMHPKIVLSNHKRDLDSLLVGGVTYFARGITHPNRRMIFALREDAFWSGFLDRYFGWPRMRRLFSWLTVKPYLFIMKVYPIGYVITRADLPRIEGQLARFADLLGRGRDLYWTPEGGLSADGRLGHFRAGFYRLVRASHAPLRILPVTLCYDFMTTLRTRCSVRFGPEFEVDRSLPKQALERLARRAILQQLTLNVGHLAAATLRDLPPGVELSRLQLERRLLDHARRYRQAGLALETRLTMGWTFRRRTAQFLGYALRQGILERAGGGWRAAQGLDHPEMRYVINELSELERELAV
ncbi:MAG TPA: lysophospholipid acyltransferase family protein [Chloroflexota bacterium]